MTMGNRVAVMKNGRIQPCTLPEGDQPATEPDLVTVRIAVCHYPHTVRMLPSQHKPDLELAAARPLARGLWAPIVGSRLLLTVDLVRQFHKRLH
jgi:hypothetical protein